MWYRYKGPRTVSLCDKPGGGCDNRHAIMPVLHFVCEMSLKGLCMRTLGSQLVALFAESLGPSGSRIYQEEVSD